VFVFAIRFALCFSTVLGLIKSSLAISCVSCPRHSSFSTSLSRMLISGNFGVGGFSFVCSILEIVEKSS